MTTTSQGIELIFHYKGRARPVKTVFWHFGRAFPEPAEGPSKAAKSAKESLFLAFLAAWREILLTLE
jgi:hypothetical protein